MSMSGDDMKLNDPNISGREKRRIRMRRIAHFWIGNVIGIVAVLVVVIVLSVIYFGLPEIVRHLNG